MFSYAFSLPCICIRVCICMYVYIYNMFPIKCIFTRVYFPMHVFPLVCFYTCACINAWPWVSTGRCLHVFPSMFIHMLFFSNVFHCVLVSVCVHLTCLSTARWTLCMHIIFCRALIIIYLTTIPTPAYLWIFLHPIENKYNHGGS